METIELVIVAFKAAGGAELYYENVKNPAPAGAVTWLDAVLVTKNSLGESTITQTTDVQGGEGSTTGALAGALVGLLGGPLGALVGAAAGAVVGGLSAEAYDLGVPDEFIAGLADRMRAGCSAVLMLVEPQYVAALESILDRIDELSDTAFIHRPVAGAALEAMLKQKGKPKGS